jgi:hypothetical protein
VDLAHEIVAGERLLQVAMLFDEPLFVVIREIGRSGHEMELRVLEFFFDSPRQRDATHPGHQHFGEDEVNSLLLLRENLARLGAISGLERRVATQLENARRDRAQAVVAGDDENRPRAGRKLVR